MMPSENIKAGSLSSPKNDNVDKCTDLSWSKKDAILYALSIGLGGQDHELPYVYEHATPRQHSQGFTVFPTMPLGLIFKGDSKPWEGNTLRRFVEFDALKLLHGEQFIEWTAVGRTDASSSKNDAAPPSVDGQQRALEKRSEAATQYFPADLNGVMTSRVIALMEKRHKKTKQVTGVVCYLRNKVINKDTNQVVAVLVSSMFLRDGKMRKADQDGRPLTMATLQASGVNTKEELSYVKRCFGPFPAAGEKAAKAAEEQPNNTALRPTIRGTSATYTVSANQHVLYRQNGDDNPIHIDPVAAKKGGLKQPILHGLCTFGMAARGLLEMFPSMKLLTMRGRFSAPVLPHDTITIHVLRTVAKKRVLSNSDNKKQPQQQLASLLVEFEVAVHPKGNTAGQKAITVGMAELVPLAFLGKL